VFNLWIPRTDLSFKFIERLSIYLFIISPIISYPETYAQRNGLFYLAVLAIADWCVALLGLVYFCSFFSFLLSGRFDSRRPPQKRTFLQPRFRFPLLSWLLILPSVCCVWFSSVECAAPRGTTGAPRLLSCVLILWMTYRILSDIALRLAPPFLDNVLPFFMCLSFSYPFFQLTNPTLPAIKLFRKQNR